MKVPGTVIGLKSVEVDGGEYEPFCDLICGIVKKTALKKGSRRDDRTYVYNNSDLKLTYIDSGYNDKFRVEIHKSVWNEIPADINPFMVNEGTEWNLVFELQDSSSKRLQFHLPGWWVNLVIMNE